MRHLYSLLVVLAVAAVAVGSCRQADAALVMSEARAVSRVTSVGTAPMFAVSKTGTQAVAWVSAPDGGIDGRLYISVDGAEPVEIRDVLGPIEAHGESPPKIVFGADGALNALYVVGKVVPGQRFPLAALRFVRSGDGGRTWSAPVTVTDDNEFGSHNFHALHAAADGALYVAWLDGREGKSAAFITHSSDGGRTWGTNRRASSGEACPCCRTAIATGADGSLYLAWRGVHPGNVRDIVVARSSDLASTWTPEKVVHPDNWVIDACPHAGPSMQVDGKGRVHIAWWTGRTGGAGVYYARSLDGGKTFDAAIPLRIAEFSQPSHVQLAVAANDRVVATWDDGTQQLPQVLMAVSDNGGESFGQIQPLSESGRAAAFPVLGVSGNDVTVAWSEQSSEEHQHAVATKPNMKDPKVTKGLTPVGNAQVLVRTGQLR